MNDDLSPATSFRDDTNDPTSSNSDQGASFVSPNDEAQSARSQQSRKANFLDNLRRNLDIVIYCQLSILYYMDCSLFRFFLRSIPHWVLFTPKPAIFPTPPSNRPYVSSIIATNGFCALVHLLMSQPEAGEATRGYLHGGLLIDFVGELGPISRWRMVLVDIFIALLQVVILGVTLERRNLKISIDSRGLRASLTDSVPSGLIPRQDLDAEEQGIRRSQEQTGSEIGLLSSRKEGVSDELSGGVMRNEHALDAFYSGQIVIADLYLGEAVRTAWRRRYGA